MIIASFSSNIISSDTLFVQIFKINQFWTLTIVKIENMNINILFIKLNVI